MIIITKKNLKIIIFILLFQNCGLYSSAEEQITLYAARGLASPIKKISAFFEKNTSNIIDINLASSGILARQIEMGAPADIYISASREWIEYLIKKKLLKASTEITVAGSQLVIISPENITTTNISFDNKNFWSNNATGKFVIGDFNHVPAGKYTKQALEKLGWWNSLKARTILAKDVHHALEIVASGEAEYGVVYYSEALTSNKVVIKNFLPEQLHEPIIFYAAICVKSKKKITSQKFLDFLSSDKSKEIFIKFGFEPKVYNSKLKKQKKFIK